MEKIRWGIIGAGGIADLRTIPGLLQCGNAQLQAVMRTDLQRAREIQAKWNCPAAYDSVEALLADPDVDAVYIATPVYLHEQQCMAAADAGKHILCEKPLAMSAREGARMVEYCRQKGVQLGAGFMMRFGTHAQAMKRLIEEGAIGRPVSAIARFGCWYPDSPVAWRQRRAEGGGGSVMDLGVHCIDLLQYILGSKVCRVSGLCDTLSFSYEVEDSATMLLQLENGCQCVVSAHFNLPFDPKINCVDILGDGGQFLTHGLLGQVDGGTVDARLAGGAVFPEPVFGNFYTRQIESFCRSVQTGTPLEVPASDAVQVQQVVEAAYRSAEEMRSLRV